jgi:hypothetical protein
MCSFIPVSDTPNGSASSQIVALLDATRGIPPRGRWVDAAAELANPFGENGCRVARSLTFGAVDVSWTSPRRHVFHSDNQSSG